MAIKSSISVTVKIAGIIFVANIIASTWILMDGQWVEKVFVNVPELGQGWLDNRHFVAWL
jgi:hypothetical protein